MLSYKPIEAELLKEEDNGILVQNIFFHVDNILGDDFRFPPTNIDKIKNLPVEAKNIWYCWSFSVEIGSSWSIYDYLVNMVWPAKEIAETLTALENINAVELTEKLKAGIPLSKSENAQFWEDEVTFGLEKLPIDHELSTFQIIDTDIGDLITKKFDAVMANYIRKHKKQF